MLLELALYKSEGKLGTVDRAGKLFEKIGYRADMILMSVGQHDTAQLILIFYDVRKIGDDKVDTQHGIIGEGHSAVDQYRIIAVFVHRDILADLVEAADKGYTHRGRAYLILSAL